MSNDETVSEKRDFSSFGHAKISFKCKSSSHINFCDLPSPVHVGIRQICTSPPPIVTGLSLTEDMTAKLDVGGTYCAHTCPDPDKPVLLSGTFGLDKYTLTSAVRIGSFIEQEKFDVQLGITIDRIAYVLFSCHYKYLYVLSCRWG